MFCFLFGILSSFFCFYSLSQFLTEVFFPLSLGETNTVFHRRRSHRCWIAFHFPFLSTSSWIHKSRLTWTGDINNKLWSDTGKKKPNQCRETFCYHITHTVRLLFKYTSVQRQFKLLILYLLKVKIFTAVFASLWLKAIKICLFVSNKALCQRKIIMFVSFFLSIHWEKLAGNRVRPLEDHFLIVLKCTLFPKYSRFPVLPHTMKQAETFPSHSFSCELLYIYQECI